MTTLCTPDIDRAPVVAMDHPLAKIVAAVRERCNARKLNFVLSDHCLRVAREHWGRNHSLPLAIDAGQRCADKLAPDVHRMRRDNDLPPAA